MNDSRRGGSFWAFIFGVALGGALGAVLMHKVLSDRHLLNTTPPPAATNAPSRTSEDSITRLLRQWRLSPDDIKRELDRTGAVIKRESGALGERLGEATLDARIVTVIKARYTLDRDLSAWDIAVAATNGHVTLSGTVNSPELIGRAVVIALNTKGVVDVVSSLRVKESATPTLPPVEG